MTKSNLKKSGEELSSGETTALLSTLKERFEKNKQRHPAIEWSQVEQKLLDRPDKLWSLNEMEKTGGEPDLVQTWPMAGHTFYDCAKESPKGRRSLCYDNIALEARPANKPVNSALGLAAEMGIELLTEEDYRQLQAVLKLDEKTSSWVKTPEAIRKLGGAIFCDRRYDTVFTYHNGAESYYGSRGFRGKLEV